MRRGVLALLIALAVSGIVAPEVLAHELTLAEVTELAEAAHETASAARTQALAGLAAGLAGLAAGVLSLVVSLRRR